MKNNLLTFVLLLVSSRAIGAGVLINGNQINPQTAISIATFSVTGAGGMAVTNSVTASSFTASGSGFKGAGTGLTGTAASLTAGNVTTNANLTGGVTSVGNAATVVTNANLTGPITSVGNATTIVGPVPTGAVDLSTVTTALALKANLNGATFTGASGITNQAFTATGANGNIVSASSITTPSGLFGGSLAISGSTFTVTPAGFYSAPSQPGAKWYRNANQNVGAGVDTPIYFDTVLWSQGAFGTIGVSSDVVTIPAGMGGVYTITCGFQWNTQTGRGYGYLDVNNGTLDNFCDMTTVSATEACTVTSTLLLAAGNTLRCRGAHAGTSVVFTGGRATFISLVKEN